MTNLAWAETTWSERSLGEALLTLAGAADLPTRAVSAPRIPPDAFAGDDSAIHRFIESTAELAGIEAEPIECTYGELAGTLASIAPALVRIAVDGERRYLVVARSNRRTLLAVTPRLARVRIAVAEVHRALTAEMERTPRQRVDRWLEVARVSPRSARRARSELLEQFLSEHRLDGMWLVRPDAGSSFARQLRLKRTLGRTGIFAFASLGQVAASMIAWGLIGHGALDGFFEPGWMAAWVLMSLSAVPLQVATAWSGGRLAMDVGALLKQRLLAGALRIDPEAVRTEGSGRLLAMVSESDGIETAGLTGALGAVVAMVQLASAGLLLFFGAGGGLHVVLLILWSALIATMALRLYRSRADWTRERFALTNSFVEHVVGNRTRVTQQAPESWHHDEDDQLDRYLASSRKMDAAQRLLTALPARGWMMLGLSGLVPPLIAGRAEPTSLAIAIGGILQAQLAFAALVGSATALVGAHVAWRSVGQLFRAAAEMPSPGIPGASFNRSPESPSDGLRSDVVLDVRGVSFRYRPTGEPVIRDLAMELREGDHLLLEGPSGGGKSTLASLLVGLRSPDSGHVLLRGLDRATLGSAGWRQRIATAPQFHENHILSASLAFNLLMGRGWPASEQDRQEATEVCRELGLGGLLDKMPAGLNQVVGETGWQLSHGERSRVFLARALLQRSEILVLDETFGALDPITLKECLETVERRAKTMIVIAHP
jgi:ATP-binding cassette subfamily B protein